MNQIAPLTEPRDRALIGLPVANTRQAGDFDEREFQNVANVPVFAEHQTVAKDGRQLKFGRNELSAIVNRCNRRIDETGDYATITIGHTPSPEERAKGAVQPDVVGFAGPYRLGTIGAGERKRYAILADFHYHKEDLPKIKKHPRRSPEVWLEDSYAEMFFDPIALLGAEAPRLDMGLLYSAQRQGSDRVVEKYTAVAPAAGNTFIPDEKLNAENEGSEMGSEMLTPDTIRQLVDALFQLPELQWVKSQMAEQGGIGGEPEPAMGGPPPAAAGDPNLPPPAPEMGPPAPPTPEMGAPTIPPGPPVPVPPIDDPEKNMGGAHPRNYNCDDKYDPKQHGSDMEKRDYGANATGEYQEVPPGGSKHEHKIGNPLSPEQTAKYAAMDELNDADMDDYLTYRKKKKYGGSVDEERGGPAPSSHPSAEPDDPGPTSSGDADGKSGGESTGEYQGTGGAELKMAREQYSKTMQGMHERLQAAEGAVEGEKEKRVNAERLNTLTGLVFQGVQFDLDKEMETLCYSKVRSDEDFAERADWIRRHAGAIPINTDLVVPFDATIPHTVPGATASAERYSKDQSTKALEICSKLAIAGENPDYESVLEDVRTGKQ